MCVTEHIVTMYSICNLCNKKILRHARNISCESCNRQYHMLCISIVPEEIEYMSANSSDWLCKLCLADIFPFNHIEDQVEYTDTIFNQFHSGSTMCYLSEKVFNPIDANVEFNEMDMMHDVDPDANFYDSIIQAISKFKYYFEDSFNKEINKSSGRQSFSMIHMNIRSDKQNLTKFESYLHISDYEFKIIVFTETCPGF